jgi:transcriptional regulator
MSEIKKVRKLIKQGGYVLGDIANKFNTSVDYIREIIEDDRLSRKRSLMKKINEMQDEKEKIKLMLELKEEGEFSPKEISEMFNVNVEKLKNLWYIYKKTGVLPSKINGRNGRYVKKISDKDIEEIIELRKQGYKHEEIAKKFGISESYVSCIVGKYRKEYNIRFPRDRIKWDIRLKVVELKKENYTPKDIAKKLHIDRTNVYIISKEYNEKKEIFELIGKVYKDDDFREKLLSEINSRMFNTSLDPIYEELKTGLDEKDKSIFKSYLCDNVLKDIDKFKEKYNFLRYDIKDISKFTNKILDNVDGFFENFERFPTKSEIDKTPLVSKIAHDLYEEYYYEQKKDLDKIL